MDHEIIENVYHEVEEEVIEDPYALDPVIEEGAVVQAPPSPADHSNDWCSCTMCHAMPKVEESVCCHEIPKVQAKAEGWCICEHVGFEVVCLNTHVLDAAYAVYRKAYGDVNINRRYRYIAYRQLVAWCWGKLGYQIRVPLPACAVNRIREHFPSNGPFIGFNLA